VLIEDRHSTPAEVAVARVDFAAWLGLLPARLSRSSTARRDVTYCRFCSYVRTEFTSADYETVQASGRPQTAAGWAR
jgi:hypothetical protein